MHDKLFEAALGIQAPWAVTAVRFDEAAKVLTVEIDFKRGSRFAVPGAQGVDPVHDTVAKEYRHLNFFQHECLLRVRVPRVKPPDGAVRLVEVPFAGKLAGFTLLFEALIRALAQQMPFAAVAQIGSVSIDMSPAFIKGVTQHLPNARIPFDKFHVVWHANAAVDKMRRIEQRTDKSLKGLRWKLLKDRSRLNTRDSADLDALIAKMATVRSARAWVYKEQLREILERKQVNVVRAMLKHWCTCVMRSKVEPMKDVAQLVRRHLDGIVAWAQTRQTNGFLEALNGLFQAAKRKARGFTRLSTIKTVIFLIAGKLDFRAINPHAA